MILKTVRPLVDRFEQFLNEPIHFGARIVLALLVVPLVMSFSQPLWRIRLLAPQYPSGLHMDIYAYTLDGGHDGHDIEEINELNHYIGMHRIDRAAFADLDWLPFAIGLMVILTLRTAAIGNVRTLVDLVVITGYVSLFAFARFVYKLYVFGHDLDPKAALKIQPFMPVVIGSKQIANFTTASVPDWGSLFMATFVLGVLGVTLWHLVVGYRAAWRTPPASSVLSRTSARAVALAVLLTAGFVSTGGCRPAAAGPALLDAARTTCAFCRMGVTDQRFASQVLIKSDAPRFFDDLSCLAGYLAERPDLPAGTRVYVADHRSSTWVSADRAIYVRASETTAAMGSRTLAYESPQSRAQDPKASGGPVIDFQEVLAGVSRRTIEP